MSNKISKDVLDFLAFLGTLAPHEQALYETKFENWIRSELGDGKVKEAYFQYWRKQND